jgi:arylsulfatase
MLGDYNCVGKRGFLDPASHIPMLMVHPDLPRGIVCDKPVNLVDIFPTYLEYADIEPQEDYSGESLAGIANGDIKRDITYGQYHRDEYAIYMSVSERYKYIYSAPDQKEWLFDLEIDPEETRNRVNNPIYIEHRDNMKNRLIEYLKKDGYTKPFDGDDFKKGKIKKISDDPDAYLLFQDKPDSIPNIPGYERDVCKSGFPREGPYKVGF